MKRYTILRIGAVAAIAFFAFRFASPQRCANADDATRNQKAPVEANGKKADPVPEKPEAKSKTVAKSADLRGQTHFSTTTSSKKDANAHRKMSQTSARERLPKLKNAIEVFVGKFMKAVSGSRGNHDAGLQREPKVDENDPVIKNYEALYSGRFRQVFRTEMHFIRTVCQPTKTEYEQIAKEGENVWKSTMRQFAIAYATRGQRQFQVAGQRVHLRNLRKQIAKGLLEHVIATLSPEQALQYQKELEHRDVARKRTALLCILNKLDKELALSREQRTKLRETLDANWDDSWSHLILVGNFDYYFPQLPDAKVLPILTKTQRDVWKGIQKVSTSFSFDFQIRMIQPMEIAEEVWDEEASTDKDNPSTGKAAAKSDRTTEKTK